MKKINFESESEEEEFKRIFRECCLLESETKTDRMAHKWVDIGLADGRIMKRLVPIGCLIADDDKPITKEQILEDIDASEEDIKMGRVKDAHRAMNDIRERLEMSISNA